MCLWENSHEKYQVVRYVIGMCIDTGMRFSMNFSPKKFLMWNFLEFIGNGIGMPM